MSDRYNDYKGSSRSARDDSRSERRHRDARRSRSRSRSPNWDDRRSRNRKPEERYSSKDRDDSREHRRHSGPSSEAPEEIPAPPPPPRITKISIGFSKPKAPIKMNIGASSKSSAPKHTVASVFNDDDDDEPEEMPAEAKMRMRNIGRETPTSAGPNSFGKTKQGFCDSKKVFEKNLKQALETADKPPNLGKFPQTIYKIKGP